jgi:hypothetical protein
VLDSEVQFDLVDYLVKRHWRRSCVQKQLEQLLCQSPSFAIPSLPGFDSTAGVRVDG